MQAHHRRVLGLVPRAGRAPRPATSSRPTGFRAAARPRQRRARRAAALPRPRRRSTRSLLSHLHPDHCIDLLPLYVARTYDPRRSFDRLPVPVYGRRARRTGWPGAYGPGRATRACDADVRLPEWTPGSHQVGPFTVTVARVAHPVEAYGMRRRARRRGAGLLRRHRPVRRAGRPRPRRRPRCSSRRRSSTGRDDHAPPDLHLTGREAASTRPPLPASADWCSPTCRRGTTPSVALARGAARPSTARSSWRAPARRTTCEATVR